MELRHLRYFVAVADALNFTKAAQHLRVAQPALSRQIQQLEAEVGVRLFERNRRSVSLTEPGVAFLKQARSILDQSAQAIRAAQEQGQVIRGKLTVGYVWGLFHSQVPMLLANFRREYPDVTVDLLDLTATQQATALQEGRLDAGFIGFAHEADLASLAKRQIGSSTFMAALPTSHPAARKRQVALKSLSGELLIAISAESYPGAWKHVTMACEQEGFRPRTLQAGERGFTILGLVASGCGVAILPESLRALPHSGIVFRPLIDPPRGDLYIAWNPERLSALRDAFLKTLVTEPGERTQH